MNSHKVRAPVARLLGILNIIDYCETQEEKEKILREATNSIEELDQVVREMNKKLEEATIRK